jgi:DNA invertase Pin-like site-specific DNA recombinase
MGYASYKIMTEMYPENRRLSYARVSTYGQTLEAQLEQLRGAGCTKIYRETVTGVRSDRRKLLKMLDTLAPGDVVTVTRIDRLAPAPSTCSPSLSRSWTPRSNSVY